MDDRIEQIAALTAKTRFRAVAGRYQHEAKYRDVSVTAHDLKQLRVSLRDKMKEEFRNSPLDFNGEPQPLVNALASLAAQVEDDVVSARFAAEARP